MMPPSPALEHKLRVLADAAKFDVSCASSGARRRDSFGARGIGSTNRSGICHSFTPDGRCISLLKVLLTNWCIYDCLYCINRESSNVERARFRVEEIVALTLDFYRRNVIEGLFLSSGIVRSPDYTMEQVVEVARQLREVHDFRGYIHLKTVPDASDELVEHAGRYADRLSVNIELPTPSALATLAPEKNLVGIKRAMARIRLRVEEAIEARKPSPARVLPQAAAKRVKAPRFAPAGQSTQMVIGADGSDDATILEASDRLYSSYRLKRVYYSAFSPIPGASSRLPARPAPLIREHRLYQADWLLRFYEFSLDDIVGGSRMLALDVDPKLAWALAHPEHFPVDLDTAPRERLLRVPGLGVKAVRKLLAARRFRRIRRADLERLSVPTKRVLPFVALIDHRPGDDPAQTLRRGQAAAPRQLDLFADA